MADRDDEPSPQKPANEVGYGRPPLHSRFKPGRSGNPRGRPKGARNLACEVASILGERVTVTENGQRKRITKLQAAIKQLVNRAASGEPRATKLLLSVVQAGEAHAPKPEPEKMSRADDVVLAEIFRRMAGGGS